jgi:hypothetical protein
MKKADEMTMIERIKAPTPTFFKKIRLAGLILGAIAAVFTQFEELNSIFPEIAGYIAVVAGVLVSIAQTAVKDDPPGDESE